MPDYTIKDSLIGDSIKYMNDHYIVTRRKNSKISEVM